MSGLGYFRWAFIVTFIGLFLGGYVGWLYEGSVSGIISGIVICAILCVLEISLSFDNAVINASKLKTMSPLWRKRFLTWGILIAVFGMRIVFPVVIVAIIAQIGPLEAVNLSFTRPDDYAAYVQDSKLAVEAFGGTFLLMVALNYFFNPKKTVDWVKKPEALMKTIGSVRGIEIAIVVILMLIISANFAAEKALEFQKAALWGFITFLAIEAIRHLLEPSSGEGSAKVATTGLGTFIYLEVLDSTFSFDGVIAAFALTTNILIIAIGLGVGAMYVRSATIYLLDTGTLVRYRYLEHGAFYAILMLGFIMYLKTIVHVPEVITGLGGVVLIALAIVSSVRYSRAHPNHDHEA